MSSSTSNPTSKSLTQTLSNRIRTLDSVRVLATGGFVPDNVVRNEDLAKLGYDADWILQRTGIRERRHAPTDMATSDMAARAARQCIEQIDANTDEIDLLIVATMTPDAPIPSTACMVQEQLGITAPAYDINAACAGFMYALVTGMQFVHSGTSQLALVVGADTNSRIVDPSNRKTFPLFGDGAGAVLLGNRVDETAATTYTLGADGTGRRLLEIRAGGSRLPITAELVGTDEQFLQMDGRSVFKWAVRMLSETIRDVVSHAGITTADLDLVVLHQANRRIIDAAAEDLGIPPERVEINVDRYGNTSAASIPLGLNDAARAGRLKEGDRVLLCGFGAGLTWGTAILEW